MQHHIIQQQLFDVSYTEAGTAYQLQSKISDIFHNQLSEAMELLFSRLVPPDVVLSMGDIEIDVGDIAYNQLEYQLADLVLFELEKAIRGRLTLMSSANGIEQAQSEIKTIEGSYAGLLEHFLLTGSLPWWASGEMLTEPSKVIQHLIVNDAKRLKQVITTAGQHSYVRQRLVQQFGKEVIRGIITILEPAQAAFIFDYHATVSKKHQEERLVESAPVIEFEKALWLFILTYILMDRGSLFNRKMFVSATLGQMARHYNRAYADILALLSKALVKYNLNDRQSNELFIIISDLSADEFDKRQTVKKRRNSTTQPLDEDEVLQDLEIIKHYLIFGSLPWWSEPYSENNLINLLLKLIRVIPAALRKVIVAAGQSDEVRKRITTAFNEEVITGIVKILEPADAAFIINYVNEVQEIHIKKPVVYTDSKDFKKAVWKFVFDFLLVERGSEFNRRMFLKSNIRRLADNYNVQYFEMLMYLVQSIGQVHQDNIDQAPLFKLLAVLLNDHDNVVNIAASGSYERRETFADTVIKRRQVVLKDVLLHWLTYGNIPWWGSAYFEQGPANMLVSLLTEAPNEAFMLLRYAGTTPQMRKRVVFQLPVALVMDVFAQQARVFPSIKHYHYLLEVFVEIAKTLISIVPAEIEIALTTLFWDTYIAAEYRSFNENVFLQKAIVYLLTKTETGNQRKVIKALKMAFESGDAGKPFKRTISKSKQFPDTGNIYLKILDEVTDGNGKIDIKENIQIEDILYEAAGTTETVDIAKVIANYLVTRQPTEQEITAEVLRILEYFAANQKLPDQFKGTNQAYITAVIKQLLSLLKKTSPASYKQLLNKATELKQYAAKQTETIVKIDGSIQQLISAYLQKERPEKGAATSEDILKEAGELLQYFLINGKLPDALLTTGSINADTLLKQLILTLYYAKSNTLNDILQRDGYLADAKMKIHNLFAITFNTAESNVSHVLKGQIEKDIAQYIKEQGAVINPDDKLAVFIQQSLGSDLTKNQQLLNIILKQSPSATRYIARYFSNEQISHMFAENASIIGGAENIIWLGELQSLIADKITDALSRDKLNTLIREFNLLVLGGHIGAAGFKVYLQELFRFMAAQNQTLFTVLSDVLIHAGSAESKVAEGFHKKLSIVLAELNIQRAGIKNEQTVKKQLDKANDDALQDIADLNAAKQKAAEERQVKDELKRREQQQADEAKTESKKLLKDHGDAIYINNAGLVLLNPFIPTYFVRTGVMNGGKFVSEEAQLRAVHLLQYLVDATTNSAEHLLVLNKILCNLPVEEPIPAEIKMTEAEKETAQSLLKAVIANWEKLKNSSVDALRGSFLIRDGSLIFKEDAWHLKIEQRGYDVLLQTLPWTIGMIKTPWMDKFLYVEWI